jgi:hypothetical protein
MIVLTPENVPFSISQFSLGFMQQTSCQQLSPDHAALTLRTESRGAVRGIDRWPILLCYENVTSEF